MKGQTHIGKLIFIGLANLLVFAIWFSWNDNYDLYYFPALQWGLCIVPLLSVWYFFFGADHSTPEIKISTVDRFPTKTWDWMEMSRHSLFTLRMCALAFLIMAFSRPQLHDSEHNTNTEGIHIVMCLDFSSSMLAEDLQPNRLEASKRMAAEFVLGRPNDRFGVVFYAGEARTMCPLTIDENIVAQQILQGQLGNMEDGTAIGLGLGYAVNRLRESEAPSKVIILLSDGENNVTEYPPLTYADAAAKFDVRVYTIGVGAMAAANGPVGNFNNTWQYGPVSSGVDEETLQKIAEITGAKYFRATDNDKLKEIYDEIDQLEKMKIESETYYNPAEAFLTMAVIGFILLAFEFVLRHTLFWSAT